MHNGKSEFGTQPGDRVSRYVATKCQQGTYNGSVTLFIKISEWVRRSCSATGIVTAGNTCEVTKGIRQLKSFYISLKMKAL
jgi:hypothetical protein